MGSKKGPKVSSSTPGLLSKAVSASNHESVKYSQEVAAKLGFQQDVEFPPLGNVFLGQMPTGITYQTKPDKAPILRVDNLGREIDEHGNVVCTTKVTNLCTLKVFSFFLCSLSFEFLFVFSVLLMILKQTFQVNLKKEKKEAFPLLGPGIDVDPGRNNHFDARIVTNSRRPRRKNFEFIEKGTWSKGAEIIKLKVLFFCHSFLLIFPPNLKVLIGVDINGRGNLERHKPKS